MSVDRPYVSFVVTARNDDHGGNLLHRMQIFVTSLLEQTKKNNLSAELILVEWNPVPDRPRLHQALSWPTERNVCKVRIIEVSPEIHRRYQYSDRLPLFQMIAKNVGIRRARGRFVLATNIDLLFSNELMASLASGSQDLNAMYRIDRYDVSSEVPADGTIDQRLEYCRRNIIRINRRDGTFRLNELRWLRVRKIRRLLKGICRYLLRFMPRAPSFELRWLRVTLIRLRNTAWRIGYEAHLFSKAIRLYGQAFSLAIRGYLTPREVLLALCLSFYVACMKVYMTMNRLVEALTMRSVASLLSSSANTLSSFILARFNLLANGTRLLRNWIHPPYPRLHTNGCGDFTLMGREEWHALRGYPELEMFSFNLDSVLCHMAYQHGVREEVFRDPMRIYHIEHASGWSPEGEKRMIERLRTSNIPMLDFQQFKSWATIMNREKRPMILNDEGWGLSFETLPETTIG